jgi:hypothetical protein
MAHQRYVSANERTTQVIEGLAVLQSYMGQSPRESVSNGSQQAWFDWRAKNGEAVSEFVVDVHFKLFDRCNGHDFSPIKPATIDGVVS